MLLDDFSSIIFTRSVPTMSDDFKNRLLKSIVTIDINNVSKTIFEDYLKHNKIYDADSFPCIIPPWIYSWFEFAMPKTMLKNTNISSRKIGGFISRFNKIDIVEILKILNDDQNKDLETFISEKIEETHWFISIGIFESTDNHLSHLSEMIFTLNKDGKIINRAIRINKKFPDKWHTSIISSSEVYSSIILYGISLCHCKNICTTQQHGDLSKINKKRFKNGKLPLFSFKILQIKSLKGSSDTIKSNSNTKLALHIRRGHMKDYRCSNGLYGKWKGIYFWDASVYGSISNGLALKTYEVKS